MNYKHIQFWQVLLASSLRYLIFAGITYFVFYIWKKYYWENYKIQQKPPTTKAVQNEIIYSVITLFIFATVIFSLLFTSLRQYTKIYTDIHEHSVLYFVFSLFAVIFIHDTYFYWTHRLMHWKRIFRFVHQIHHRSHNPTPLAAFSFHPLEAIIEIGVLPLIVLLFPIHRAVIGVFGIYMITMNVIGHLGYELFPKWFLINRFSRWLNTSTHHNMHHHYGKGNYGLYFNFWDRLFRTNHPDYEKQFHEVVANRDAHDSTALPRNPIKSA